MKRLLLFVGMSLLLIILPRGEAGKDARPTLPAEAYQALTERSIKTIVELAQKDGKGARERINVEAAILAGYTLRAKNPGDDGVAQLRGAALAADKTDLKNLAKFADLVKSAAKAPAKLPMNVDLKELMEIFKTKIKGGEGIPPELQYQQKLKNLNGSEALIGALATKKLNDDNMKKVAAELPNLAYRIAVVADITEKHVPKKGEKQWRALSANMRDASFAVAEAAQKKNANGVFTAAQALETSCTSCHSEFKGK